MADEVCVVLKAAVARHLFGQAALRDGEQSFWGDVAEACRHALDLARSHDELEMDDLGNEVTPYIRGPVAPVRRGHVPRLFETPSWNPADKVWSDLEGLD